MCDAGRRAASAATARTRNEDNKNEQQRQTAAPRRGELVRTTAGVEAVFPSWRRARFQQQSGGRGRRAGMARIAADARRMRSGLVWMVWPSTITTSQPDGPTGLKPDNLAVIAVVAAVVLGCRVDCYYCYGFRCHHHHHHHHHLNHLHHVRSPLSAHCSPQPLCRRRRPPLPRRHAPCRRRRRSAARRRAGRELARQQGQPDRRAGRAARPRRRRPRRVQ